MDLDALVGKLDGYVAQVQSQIAREMEITAATGSAIVIQRVSETGRNAEGANFPPYTQEYELFKRGASSATLTTKKRTARATADKPIGRFTGFRNFTLTGDMLGSIGIIEQRTDGGRFVVRVGARDDFNREKMIGNDTYAPGWFLLSKAEQEKLAEQSAVRMASFAEKFLGP